MLQPALKSSSFRQGIAGPVRARSESSHMDVKLWTGIAPKSCSNDIGKLPSMALDTGIPAGMTLPAEASC